ncbi:hypothetical protein [Rufibacter sp. XAAS-G3-1]|uniref:hypothetical protein n=1 Tax=Rufibacter sp. XAAS-G3-1 TaxID=2729134 RepID=UPI0015E71F98|nr:hypothetical protein [Rufibacter sp. XAAS-G3-1]
MSKLKESTTQDRALVFLKKHYTQIFSKAGDEIYCEKEKRTRKESGGKRADGLLCFEKEGKPYTISLEAKSHKTLNALISSTNDEKFLLQSVLVSSVLTLLTVLGFSYYTLIAWYYIAFIAIAVFIMGVFFTAFIFDFLDLDSHRAINVVNQLKQYPANEQWIAFSKHTDNLLLNSPFKRKRNHIEVLEKLCRKNGFGLLLVTRNGCDIKVCPTPKKGQFLYHYCREQEILKAIKKQE